MKRSLAAAVCLVLTACSGSSAQPRLVPVPSTPAPVSAAASPSPAQASPDALVSAVDDLERGAWAPGRRLEVNRRPSADSDSHTVGTTNPMGQRLVFLVTDVSERQGRTWLRVLLPRRPNGSEGWVPDSRVNLTRLRDRIEVDLSSFTLTRFHDGRRIARYRVGVGQPQWPTPTGTFYVWAQVPQPNPAGPYGAYALGLSGFSPVLTDWPGGGRFAIHGTVNRWDTGRRISHGCIRVFNPQVKQLRDVPMGTPVIVTR